MTRTDPSPMPKVITLGEILVEIMAHHVGQSLREPGTLLGPYASGAPAIFIDQVGKMGVAAAMVGCVGDDDFGHLNRERLARDGVDISGIWVLPDATTGSAFVTYRHDGQRDFVFNIRDSASGRLGPEHITDQVLAGCTHVHVMGSSLFNDGLVAATMLAVQRVRRQGGTVSFDPNVRKEILRSDRMREALVHCLRHCDIFLPSGPELTLLVDAKNEDEAIARLQALGVQEIVIKRGALGATAVIGAQRFDVAPLSVTEVDPTGAGDCFGATYVACRVMGMPPAEALSHANAAGALAVTQRGPMEGTSTLEQQRQRLALHS